MVVKFNRSVIESINNIQSSIPVKNNSASNKRLAVPEKETFNYIFKSAINGNEMAAVLIDEWQRSCTPKDKSEEQIITSINVAANRIFK